MASSIAAFLQAALLDAAQTETVVPGEQDVFGQRYVVDFELRGPSGTAIVRSTWIIRTNEDVLRLARCYVL